VQVLLVRGVPMLQERQQQQLLQPALLPPLHLLPHAQRWQQ
jgi:hypothetical protein